MPRNRSTDMGITGIVLTVLSVVAGLATFLYNLVPTGDAAMREGWEE